MLARYFPRPVDVEEKHMVVVLIRHGKAEIAATPASEGKPDELRELTRDGKKKMRRAARGLLEICPKLDLIATSPLRRAVQTADVLAWAYRASAAGVPMVELQELTPGKRSAPVLAWL